MVDTQFSRRVICGGGVSRAHADIEFWVDKYHDDIAAEAHCPVCELQGNIQSLRDALSVDELTGSDITAMVAWWKKTVAVEQGLGND